MSTYLSRISIFLFCLTAARPGLCADGNGAGSKTSAEISTPEVNHVYFVLQQSTIDSIARTPFISTDFAAFQQRRVNASEDVYFGTYLNGQRAYLEIFAPGGVFGYKKGDAGIGLSTSVLGQFQAAKASLRALAGDRAEDGLRVRVLDADTIPWFQWASLKGSDTDSFSAWLMEFTDAYLHAKGVSVDSSRLFSRHDLLVAKTKPADTVPTSSTMFDDIVAVDLELNKAEYSDLELLAQALGIKGTTFADSGSFNVSNCVVKVKTNEERQYCIRRLVCTLTRAVESPVRITFGPDARLEVRDDQAVWYFGL